MKKVSSVAMLTLIAITLFSGSVMANAMGDENYYGENGEQPGIGVDTGLGEQNSDMPVADRTRNKDASVITVLSFIPSVLVVVPISLIVAQ
jgi:hypothetical protein